MAILNKIKTWKRLRYLRKIREHAMEYMAMLNSEMIRENMPRAERRRFQRELVKGVKLNG